MITILNSIDLYDIKKDYIRLNKDMQWTEYGHKGKQCGIQYKANEDPWSSSVGKSKSNELDYIHLNPYFKDTAFENVINEYKLLRTRLMWVGPYACYSMHVDQNPRIHIPMITNKECYFVFKNKLIEHLPAGNVYYVDTRETHTFMNCSDTARLHLVGVVQN